MIQLYESLKLLFDEIGVTNNREEIPADVDYPYIVYTLSMPDTSDIPITCILQIDGWGATKEATDNMLEALDTALNGRLVNGVGVSYRFLNPSKQPSQDGDVAHRIYTYPLRVFFTN